MWVKLDDEFPVHHKLTIAGRHIGRQATGRVLAVFVEGLCWSNKHHTEGFLPAAVVGSFRHDRDPLQVAAALVWARFWEPADGGWRIHNWGKYQLDEARRAAISQARSSAGKKGAESRWHGQKNGNHGKSMTNNAPVPVPVPFASNEAKTRARELRAESVSGAQPLPPPSRDRETPSPQPKTFSAFRCPHDPMCESYTACIDRALAEGKV